MVLHLVRHGRVHNPEAILYGRLPRFRLDPKGEEQARDAGAHLASRASPPAVLYSSPLLRARQTAALIQGELRGATGVDAAVNTDDDMIEVHTPYTGVPIEYLNKRGWHLSYQPRRDDAPGEAPQGPFESFEDVGRRVERFIGRMYKRHASVAVPSTLAAAARTTSPPPVSPEVVCVSHGDVIFCAKLFALGLPLTLASRTANYSLYPRTASVVSLSLGQDGSVVDVETWSPHSK